MSAVDDAAGEAGDTLSALARSASRTDEAGSAQVEMKLSMPGAPNVEMDGVWSWGKGMAFDVEMDAASVGMAELVEGENIRMLYVDGGYYYDIDPDLMGAPAGGKEWIRVDADAVVGQNAVDVAQNGNPVAGLHSIKLSDDVESVGEETVLGREATHYSATLDKDDIGRGAELLAQSEKNTLLRQLTGGDVSSIELDIWVDGKDLPVRIEQKLGPAVVSIDFTSFGRTKKILAPPASETTDMTELIKQQQDEEEEAAAGSGQG
ncbi:hypothetical protein ACFVU3_11275 [Streptomyces sp. NPDC058052]|uniref:hypothetical protein n=1 Tax=Streptomyces sp. NPDC058052 TaxID=3346316 RepID=UPI0036E96F14